MSHSFRTGNVKSLTPPTNWSLRLKLTVLVALFCLGQWAARTSHAAPSDAAPTASPAPAADAAATPPPLEPPPPNVMISPATPDADKKPAAEPSKPVAHPDFTSGPKFIGSNSCSASLCHGGASPDKGRNAFTIWQKFDHHTRSYITLAGERSRRMAQALALPDPKQTRRCTECHAPNQGVNEARMASTMKPDEGISCENCHGPAENWIRSHTRTDFTYAQNIQTGVRELRGLYARANSCVACHQVLPPDILQAGHPPLIFELDAQMVAEPKHWMDEGEYVGPKAWMVGQAVALRETSWSLSQQAEAVPEVREQWKALVWLVQRAADAYGGDMPKFDLANAADFSPGNVARAQSVADDIAKAAGRLSWSRGSTRRTLNALAATHKEFVPTTGESVETQQHRAQRLVLALARLMAPFEEKDMKGWKAASTELDKLFKIADARVSFDSGAFATQLEQFEKAMNQSGSSDETKVAER